MGTELKELWGAIYGCCNYSFKLGLLLRSDTGLRGAWFGVEALKVRVAGVSYSN